MSTQTIVLVFGTLFGLGAGFFTARSSNRREKIYGGTLSQVFHYLGASFISALPVIVISSAIFVGVRFAFTVALSVFVMMWASMLLFATVEKAPREQALNLQEDRGWTEQDARSSGL